MAKRICKLTDKKLRETVDLRNYEDLIIDTINEIAPGKNPVVEKDHFSTDVLTHSEAVKIGFALAETDIAKLGIVVSIFRLFNGHIVKDKEEKKEKRSNDRNNKKVSNHNGDTTTISSCEQETNQSIGEAVS